jgi:hypothetical protein
MKPLRLGASAFGVVLLLLLAPACERQSASLTAPTQAEEQAHAEQAAAKPEGADANPPKYFPEQKTE